MSKLRDSARGQECQVRLPGICNFDRATTVLAHLNGGGMAMKQSDLFGAYSCSSCHDIVDGRTNPKRLLATEIKLAFYEGDRKSVV